MSVVLDLDGVIVDTEEAWDRARRAYVAEHGGSWRDEATRATQGMSSKEWAAYLRDELGAAGDAEAISAAVARTVVAELHEGLPLLPGAVAAVRALAATFPLALASSANREVIDAVLDEADLAGCFRVTVSSEEVARGKPAPDVYLDVTARLGVAPDRCVAVEDSSSGLQAAHAAGLIVVAAPNRAFPPSPDALALAAVTVAGIRDVTPALVRRLLSAGR